MFVINYYAIVTYACITLKESKHRSSEYKLVTKNIKKIFFFIAIAYN